MLHNAKYYFYLLFLIWSTDDLMICCWWRGFSEVKCRLGPHGLYSQHANMAWPSGNTHESDPPWCLFRVYNIFLKIPSSLGVMGGIQFRQKKTSVAYRWKVNKAWFSFWLKSSYAENIFKEGHIYLWKWYGLNQVKCYVMISLLN